MRALLSLAGKDLRILLRDRFALFWVFAFPLMYALFFGSLFGSDDGDHAQMSIAIVDEAGSSGAEELIERLAAHESLTVARDEDGAVRRFSIEQARAAVRRGTYLAYVRIPAGYAASPFSMFGAPEEGSRLEVGIDPSHSAEAGFLHGVLMEVLFSDLGERFTDKDFMREEVARVREEIAGAADLSTTQKAVLDTFMRALERFVEDIDFDDAVDEGGEGEGFSGMGDLIETVDVTRERDASPRSAFDVTFPSAMIWGLMSVALGFGIGIVREKTQGTYLRLRVAPIGRAQLLAGKALACFTTCVLVMAFLVAFGALAMGVRFSSLPLLTLAVVCTALCFTGIMMTVANLGRSEQAVAGAAWGVMMPFAMIGGGMIPLIAMPPWLARLSDFSPFKWGILAIEGAVWRDFTAGDMVLPCAVLLTIGAACFTLGVLMLRRADS